MLAVVKKPRTKKMLFQVKGEIPSHLLTYLEQSFGQDVEVVEEDEECINIFETDWYHEIQEKTTPGEILRIYRENVGMSQAELAKKLGNLTRQKISDMEHNRRSISKEMARKISQIFKVPVERFLYGI
jgi:antitoxin component HigA of HigAB toxin-antitoxin module